MAHKTQACNWKVGRRQYMLVNNQEASFCIHERLSEHTSSSNLGQVQNWVMWGSQELSGSYMPIGGIDVPTMVRRKLF